MARLAMLAGDGRAIPLADQATIDAKVLDGELGDIFGLDMADSPFAPSAKKVGKPTAKKTAKKKQAKKMAR